MYRYSRVVDERMWIWCCQDGSTGHSGSTNVEHESGAITRTVSHAIHFFLIAGISLVVTDCGPVKLIYTHAAHAKPTPNYCAPNFCAQYRINVTFVAEDYLVA